MSQASQAGTDLFIGYYSRQDDNTWADADTNYFYYAWCDRSRTWSSTFDGQPYSRPDADVKLVSQWPC